MVPEGNAAVGFPCSEGGIVVGGLLEVRSFPKLPMVDLVNMYDGVLWIPAAALNLKTCLCPA